MLRDRERKKNARKTGSSSPYTAPEVTARYVTKWVDGAKQQYGLDLDYVGVWNERAANGPYVKQLRQSLDDAGFRETAIVAADGGASICDDLAQAITIYIYLWPI